MNEALSLTVGVIGADSLVGGSLLPLLAQQGADVYAFTRKKIISEPTGEPIKWMNWENADFWRAECRIDVWISLAPIWVLPGYFQCLENHCKKKRIIALSSSSIFTKVDSSNTEDLQVVQNLRRGEESFINWAQRNEIDWTLFRPTLIYKPGFDQNLSRIAFFIQRFGFFPILGGGKGLRQPVHADDIARGCILALKHEKSCNKAYTLSGFEEMSYRQMVAKVFDDMGRKTRIIRLPLWLFRLGVMFLKCFPRFSSASLAMIERMNQNMAFSSQPAQEDFGYSPQQRSFWEGVEP